MTLIRRARVPVLALLAALTVPVGAAGATATAAAAVEPPRAAVLAAGEQRTLTLAAAPTAVAPGRPASLTGRLADGTGAPLPGAAVRLESRAEDGSWPEVALLSADSDGRVTVSQSPLATTVYRLHHGYPGSSGEAVSQEVTVSVRTLTARWAREAVKVGRDVTVLGALDAGAGARLRLERHSHGAWKRAGRTRTAADGTYSFVVPTTVPGFSRWRVVRGARGDRQSATVLLPRLEAFRLHRYSVTTRGAVRVDVAAFSRAVASTLGDPRGWERAHRRFREVRRGGDFTVVLSQASRLPGFSSVCSTRYSCRVGRYVVINQDRWRGGSPYFPGTLREYRQMVVNHETGHWLGRGHAYCPGRGQLAPVMQQQSKGMQGCAVNPWPLDREARAVS